MMHAIKRSGYDGDGLLETALCCLLLSCALTSAAPEKLKSAFWEPYCYDVDTTALFHFDGGGELPAEEGDLFSLGEASPSEGLQRGSAAPDAVPMGAPMPLVGACGIDPEGGRFGGSLKFDGKDGKIGGDLPAGPKTIEFWACLDKLPLEKAVVLSVVPTKKAVKDLIELWVEQNGRLKLLWGGITFDVDTEKWTPGIWRHYALLWDGRSRADLLINGRSAPLEGKLDPAFGSQHVRYFVGNNSDGTAGLCGRIDELRCSKTLREYYEWNLTWVDAKGERPRLSDWPYFRDGGDLLLYLDFNRHLSPAASPEKFSSPVFDPEAQAREDELQPEKARRLFTEGVEREALVLSKNGLAAVYRGKGFAFPRSGTIAFWVRPLNWNNYVRWNRFAPWSMKLVPVFTLMAGGRTAASFLLVQTPDEDNCAYPVDLNPGSWTHICVAWDAQTTVYYLNGVRWLHSGSWQWRFTPWQPSEELTLILGRDESTCALDDFRIYSRMLSPTEIGNLYAMFDRRKELRKLPPIDVVVSYNGVAGRVAFDAYLLDPNHAQVSSLSAVVWDCVDSRAIGQKDFKCGDMSRVSGTVVTEKMKFHSYEMRFEAKDEEGRPLFQIAEKFQREQPPWWGNKIGISDRVMPDWDPLRADGKRIFLSQRTVEFSDSGLPERIVSAGVDLLAAPLALLVTDGKEQTSTMRPCAGAFAVRRCSEVKAEFAGMSEGDGIVAAVDGYVEFDGMMWFSVALKPTAGPVVLRGLALEIPYLSVASTFVHWWSGNHGFRDPRVVHIGALPPGEGVAFSSTDPRVSRYHRLRGSFIPYVMLCGDRCGMAWFAENDKGWTQSTNTPAVVLERRKDAVVLRLNIITEPVTIEGERIFQFGLQPIPVRRLRDGWRATPNWGVFPDSFCGFNLKGGSATDFFRHPENMDWDAVAKRFGERPREMEREFVVGFKKAYGRDPMPHETIVYGLYYDLRRIDAFPAHTREWGDMWPTARFSPEIVDYCVWIWDEWLSRGLAKGVYMDDCYNAPLDSLDSGVAYTLPDGYVQPGVQWLGQREMLKRFRQASWDRGIVPHMCAHTTHTYFIPYHSFFDTILDGEDFYQHPQEKRDFMDSWSPDRLRFMHPEKWGPVSTWLGWTEGGTPFGKYPTWTFRHNRAYAGALLVHDLLWTVGLGNYVTGLHHEWVIRSRIRVDESIRFIPYWESGGAVRHDHDGLYVSAWVRPDWCAIALANWTTNRLNAVLHLDLQTMGFAGADTARIKARDVDPYLLTYFDDDVSVSKKPSVQDMDTSIEDYDDVIELEEKPTLEQRRAADPDGFWEWGNGVLKCAVRAHDFRLFELSK